MFPASLSFDERSVLANEKVEVSALFVGELEEDLLAFGILEALAVFLEEAVRSALASDSDHQRLLIVNAVDKTLSALGEQAVRCPFEEQEGRAGLEMRVAPQQLGIPILECGQMFLFLGGEVVEDLAAAGVLGHARRAGVELEPAPLGGNCDAERVPREHQIAVAMVGLGRMAASGATVLTLPVNLDHALRRGEAARGSDLLDQRFDIGTEELEGFVAGLADQVEVTRLPVTLLEAEPAFPEIDLPGDAGFHHPLKGAVNGGATDAA